MRLSLRNVTCLLILLCGLFTLNLPADAAEVGGIISSNAKWTADQSPYLVTGNILIKKGVTLEIEAGVTVRFATAPIASVGYFIQVDGTLQARGTQDNPILFTAENKDNPWGCIAFTDSSTDWKEEKGTGCILSHCIIEYAGNQQEAAVICVSASSLISDNTIRNNVSGGIKTAGGFQKIVNNLIHDNTLGIKLSCEGALIENNYLISNQQGLYIDESAYTIEIKNNSIIAVSSEAYGACIGIHLFYNAIENASASEITKKKLNILISNNNLSNTAGNAVAVTEEEAEANYELSITGNNIENTEGKLAVVLYKWKHENPSPIDMSGNWWGTADTAQINRMIFDAKNDFYLPEVKYAPIAAEKIAGTGSSLSYEPPQEEIPDQPGVISKDAVWTLDNSPYYVSGNIWVRENITLEIEPGVEVIFKTAPVESLGYYLRVDGALRAKGTAEKPILFTAESSDKAWGCIAFTDTARDWDESTSQGCVLSHCIIEYAGNNQSAAILSLSASPLIADNIIRYNTTDGFAASGGNQHISGNLIHHNKVGINLSTSESGLIENNYIADNKQGIYLNSVYNAMKIQNNTVSNTSAETSGGCLGIILGYHKSEPKIEVHKNHFISTAGNAVAVSEADATANSTLTMTDNNIVNSGGNLSVFVYNWKHQNPEPVHAENNWWGTSNAAEIDSMIFDANNDFYLPEVIYKPFAVEKLSDSGSSLSYPPPTEEEEEEEEEDTTDQPGVIREDTVWTLEQSPYLISGNIRIKENVKLEIEPGVSVIFKAAPLESVGYYIQVDGILHARGEKDKPIRFTTEDPANVWGAIVFTETATGWDETNSEGCVLSNCLMEYGGNAQDGGKKEYGGASVLCLSASPLIENNLIRYSSGNGIQASGGSVIIRNNRIHNTSRAIVVSGADARIENNYLMYNAQGIYAEISGNAVQIRRNSIINDSPYTLGACLGLMLIPAAADETGATAASDIVIQQNHFLNRAGNAVAMSESAADAEYKFTFSENNIEQARFRITAASLLKLKEAGVPTDITSSLETLKDDEFTNKKDFETALEKTLGKEQASHYQAVILSNAENQDVNLAVYFYAWKNSKPGTVQMTENWWGTSDTAEIADMICDAENDFYLPQVIYLPITGQSISAAWSDLPYPPIANAGADKSVDRDVVVSLDGSGSFNPFDLLSFQWTQTGGYGVRLSDAAAVKPTFVAPAAEAYNRTLTFQLTVKDPLGFSHTDHVSVTVLDSGVAVERDKGQCFIDTAGDCADAGTGKTWGWLLVISSWFLAIAYRRLARG
ncbi:MAG: hypothetical protein BWK80_20140 [Desulfobacteraceae bacterium IS3]|nr:MAG: hypothetical protein BWK80_20140 [Desulfobacteraceae bacterium IS3]